MTVDDAAKIGNINDNANEYNTDKTKNDNDSNDKTNEKMLNKGFLRRASHCQGLRWASTGDVCSVGERITADHQIHKWWLYRVIFFTKKLKYVKPRLGESTLT